MLKSHDKLSIRMIDQQMKELVSRKTSDEDMLKILSDFIPDVKYILRVGRVKEMKMHLKESPQFAYFSRLVEGKKPVAKTHRYSY